MTDREKLRLAAKALRSATADIIRRLASDDACEHPFDEDLADALQRIQDALAAIGPLAMSSEVIHSNDVSQKDGNCDMKTEVSPREFWIGFGGDPAKDKKRMMRTVSGEPFEPFDFNEEIIHVREVTK